MAFIVHRSNRLERLVDALAAVVSEPSGAPPQAGEVIVVQGRGMAHWLGLELARRLGIWANPDFPFPRPFVERVLALALGPEAAPAPVFAPEFLRWHVAAALVAARDRPDFGAVRAYLADDPRGIKLLQLAGLVADTLDQYLAYRPDLILRWEAGEEAGDWQAELWRMLARREGGHLARRARHFRERLADTAVAARLRQALPRVSVFGLATLPPLHLDLLAALGTVVPVHLFALAPTPHYWADLQRPRPGAADDAAAAGHPLLASLGLVGREFQDMLEGLDGYEDRSEPLFEEPRGTSMLAVLQGDMWHVRSRGVDPDCPVLPIDPDDRSISVHACHGPMREVEVLHDQLLDCFDADPTLGPDDVVVLCTDVDAYAPYIDAVFGRPAGDPRAIPYRIADRRRSASDPVALAFQRLLATAETRFTASTVLDLLDLEPVRERAELVAADLDTIRTWVREARICWGFDADDRASEGQPRLAANTWRFGLDRLFLGYAMDGLDARLFGGVLPVDGIEGQDAAVLGRLAGFSERLFGWRARLRERRPVAEWATLLAALAGEFLSESDPYAPGVRALRAALAAVAARAAAAGFAEPVPLESVRAEIVAELDADAPPVGFLAGPVTFCALVPMRSIPFRVVALLGMNDGAFPRSGRRASFDRRAAGRRPGDRSPREDDRYLFLEALLSARERLIVTYVGQSQRDNTPLPPSVVVSDLLDALDQGFAPPPAPGPGGPARTARDHVVVVHPLQPFSPRYFDPDDDPRLFSYAADYCTGAAVAAGTRRDAPPFVPGPLPLSEAPATVTLDELVRFFRHPVREFCRQRLRLWLREDDSRLADREPIEVDDLDVWTLGDRALRHAEAGLTPEQSAAVLRASGALPLGTPGEVLVRDVIARTVTLRERARELRSGPCTPLVRVDLELGGVRLTGTLRNVWPQGLVEVRYGAPGGLAALELWIRHLLLCCTEAAGPAPTSTLLGVDKDAGAVGSISLAPADRPREYLEGLLGLWRVGLEWPLPFFRQASWKYACASADGKDGLKAAAQAYYGDEAGGRRGDRDDPEVRRVFGTCDPLGDAVRVPHPAEPGAALGFAEVAWYVYGPLLAHCTDRTEVRGGDP